MQQDKIRTEKPNENRVPLYNITEFIANNVKFDWKIDKNVVNYTFLKNMINGGIKNAKSYVSGYDGCTQDGHTM